MPTYIVVAGDIHNSLSFVDKASCKVLEVGTC